MEFFTTMPINKNTFFLSEIKTFFNNYVAVNFIDEGGAYG